MKPRVKKVTPHGRGYTSADPGRFEGAIPMSGCGRPRDLDCSIPISAEQRVCLEEAGELLAWLRRDCGLSRATVADAADLNVGYYGRLERGRRRPRRSTLYRIASVLTANGVENTSTEVVDALVCLLGPALAPESDYPRRRR